MAADLAFPDFPADDKFEVDSSLSHRDTYPTFAGERSVRSPRNRLRIQVFDGEEPQWLKPITMQIDRILRLEEGWDSYGARSIKPEAIAGMIKLLARVGTNVAPPAVFPASDGGILIEWNTAAGSVEIKFSGENQLSLFAEEPGGAELEEECVSQATFCADCYPKIKHLIPQC